jgi:hypothetical protein
VIRRRHPLKRTGRIRQVSKKRAKDMITYHALRAQFLSDNPICQGCQVATATDVHHKQGRTGKNYLDTTTWAPLCRKCHTWVHENRNEARLQDL